MKSVDKGVVLITGAASGIGEATARLFSERGASVVLADLNYSACVSLSEVLPRSAAVEMDVTNEEEMRAGVDLALTRFGRVDCLVNNAGIVGAVGAITQTTYADWRLTMDALVDGVFFGIKHAAQPMIAQGSGCILNVASVAGLRGGLGPHAYTAAKHAVVGLTRSAGSELARHNIRVNAVAPGATATPLLQPSRFGGRKEVEGYSAKSSPLGKTIFSVDVAEALYFLASDVAKNITGQVLAIDGGRSEFAPGCLSFHAEKADFVAMVRTPDD
tara:strand:- start:59051 stop:59869 length:819 start_codon:yes stop_codon:yes gene_type:complete